MKQEKIEMPVINPKAGGIDVGGSFHYVCTGGKAEDVSSFGVYTEDLEALVKFLKDKGIETVALESTGSYWQVLFAMLQENGLNPILVSGKFTKQVQGKKTDVQDCQWIQKMHSLGLLPNSYLPDQFTEEIRSYVRHRQGLIENKVKYVQKMQKALRLMNFRLDNAISDITGKSGKAMIRSILEGKTDADELAGLADRRVRKSKEDIAKAMKGIYKEQHIFELRQSYDLYNYFEQKIKECDEKINNLLEKEITSREEQTEEQRPTYENKKRKKPGKNAADIDMQKIAYEISGGIDLSEIEGVGSQTLLSLISEIGMAVSKFPSAKHFCSWLGLAPNNKKTGGKVFSSKTSKNKNALSLAFQKAANTIETNLKSGFLYQFFKRIQAKKGRREAIIATARKLGVIIWNMLNNKEKYNPTPEHTITEQQKQKAIKNMTQKMNRMGISVNDLQFE